MLCIGNVNNIKNYMKKIILFFLIVHCTLVIAPPYASRFIGKDCMCQWTKVYTCSAQINCFAVSGSNIYVGTNGVLLSTNNGVTWNWINSGITNKYIFAFAISGQNIFAGYMNVPGSGGGVLLSTNNGTSWNPVNNGFPTNRFVNALAFKNTNLYAGTPGDVVLSTNYGNNWNIVYTPLPIHSLAVSGNYMFAATNYGVHLSTNNGVNWTQTGVWEYFNVLITSGTTLFAGGTGVYYTTNYGSNWNSAGLTNHTLYSFAFSGTNLFAGTDGIYLTINNGVNWFNKNQGLNVTPVFVQLTISNNYVFAGIADNVSGNTIWRRSLSEITEVKSTESKTQNEFKLFQNYPNPFNPNTNIKYQIANKKYQITNSNVTLKVYNILGKEIATLVNKKQSQGTYEVTFDGSQYPSGVYFYKLETQNYIDTKKMLLIK